MTTNSKHPDSSKSKGLYADITRLAPTGSPGRGRRLAAVLLTRALPPLQYPINSGAELAGQLHDSRTRFMGVTINTKRGINHIPAHYFPIASMENFVEKIATLLKGSRLPLPMRSQLKKFAVQLPGFEYPIADSAALTRQIAVAPEMRFRGERIDPHKTVSTIPKQFFPIESKNDFAFKVAALAGARALRASR